MRVTSRDKRPSSSRIRAPCRTSAARSAYVVGNSSPRATSSGANTTVSPARRTRGAVSLPTRMRGPCRSTSTATATSAASAAFRTAAIQLARSSGVPWDEFTRMTFAPAPINPAMPSGVPVAGPSVATILVRRIRAVPPLCSPISFQHSKCLAQVWKTLPRNPRTRGRRMESEAALGGRVKWMSTGRIEDALQVVSRSDERPWRRAGVMHKDTHTCNPLVHDPDLPLFEPLFELLEQVNRAGDARCGQSLDGAGREPALELAGAQQHFEAPPREGHAHTAVVCRVRRGLDQPLGLESLDERGGGRAGHAQLGGDLLGAGAVRPTQVDGHQRCLGPVRQAVGAERAVTGSLRCRLGGDDGVGQLQGQLGTICHASSVIRYPYTVEVGDEVNMLIVNILITFTAAQGADFTDDG